MVSTSGFCNLETRYSVLLFRAAGFSLRDAIVTLDTCGTGFQPVRVTGCKPVLLPLGQVL